MGYEINVEKQNTHAHTEKNHITYFFSNYLKFH